MWPGLCLYCWSQSEGPEAFPSNQPAVCLYLLTAPTGSQSGKRKTEAEKSEITGILVRNKLVTITKLKRNF